MPPPPPLPLLFILKQNTGHTHNTRTTTQPNTRTKYTTEPLSSDLFIRAGIFFLRAGIGACRV